MENERKTSTIGDIARELGVSKSTVSRAISGKGRIGADTRRRVLECIERYGYRPNAAAAALARSRTWNIGLVLPIENVRADLPFFHECTNGICEAAYAANYDVMISMLSDTDLSQLRRLLAGHKVDGIILSRAGTDPTVPGLLNEYRMPFVVVGPSTDPQMRNVDNRNAEASRELTGLMLMKGMRRLALIGGSRRHLVTGSRREGFLRAHEEYGAFVNEKLIFLDVENHVQAMQAVNRILASGADGIVCMDDLITGMVMSCLKERGVQVPEGIRVASLYDSPQIEHMAPPVTSVRFNTKELGGCACRLLLRLLGEAVPEETSLPNYQVILRESTK